MKNISPFLLVFIFILAGCAKQTQVLPPTTTLAPATTTGIPQTETSAAIPFKETSPASTLDPTLFGAIGINEIQAFVLESVVSAIFNKTLDGFVASGSVQEYQTNHVMVFPGSGGLLAEVIYSVKTTDPIWLSDDGAQLADGWIANNCSRFDFVTTETEYQLKNRRTCN